ASRRVEIRENAGVEVEILGQACFSDRDFTADNHVLALLRHLDIRVAEAAHVQRLVESDILCRDSETDITRLQTLEGETTRTRERTAVQVAFEARQRNVLGGEVDPGLQTLRGNLRLGHSHAAVGELHEALDDRLIHGSSRGDLECGLSPYPRLLRERRGCRSV